MLDSFTSTNLSKTRPTRFISIIIPCGPCRPASRVTRQSTCRDPFRDPLHTRRNDRPSAADVMAIITIFILLLTRVETSRTFNIQSNVRSVAPSSAFEPSITGNALWDRGCIMELHKNGRRKGVVGVECQLAARCMCYIWIACRWLCVALHNRHPTLIGCAE
jgi:hypothetical protein